jgi:PAS domain S-box-containing protein
MPNQPEDLPTMRASERRLRAIVESATDYAIIATDTDGAITSWNRGAENVLGWSEAEALGRTIQELIFTPEDRAVGIPATEMTRARTEGRASDERLHMRKDGSRFWARGEMMPLRDDGSEAFEGYLKILRDRTTQRRLREAHAEDARALQASEERLQLALDAAGIVGTWDWDVVNDRLVTDERFARLFAVNPERAMAGAPLARFIQSIHAEDRPRVEAALAEAVANAGDFAEEYRVHQADGTLRWVFARGHCYRGEDGKVVRCPGVAVDITARKQVEDELRAAQHRTTRILESISDAFYALDREGRFTYVNAKAEELWGRRRGELLGKVLWDEFPQARGTESEAAHRLAAREGKVVRFETLSPMLKIWVDASIFPGEDGVAVYFRDVSERRRRDEALREAEARARLAMRAAQLGTWDFDPIGGRLVWDDRCRELLGPPPEAPVTYRTFVDGVHPDDRERMEQVIRHSLDPEGPGAVEEEYRAVGLEDGRERWLVIIGQAFFDQDVATRFTGVVMDITERKQAEQHLNLLVNELNHRVKNTLAMVQAIASQTMRNASGLDEAREAFSARLMSLARAHDVLTQENWESAALRTVVVRALESHVDEAQSRLRIEGPAVRLPPKTALTLSMALHELATNAIKHGAWSRETGEVEVSWRIEEAPGGRRLRLRWRERGGPPVAAPSHRGFGTQLIERGLAAELGGEVRLTYDAAGAVCTVDAPLPEA